MPAGAAPLLSVTVPTRGRAEHLRECVASVLACEGVDLEVTVVDQSDDDASERALAPLLGDPRLRYLRSETRGVCAGRNVGARASRGEILVCTDDDCRASVDWLLRIAEAFEAPGLGLLCGRVRVPEELYDQGYTTAYDAPPGRTTIEGMIRGEGAGITANMSFRRSLFEALGGFDEALGSGGPLGSGGEPDFIFRALLQGAEVRNDPRPVVTHLGVRRGADAIRALVTRYYFGTGAAYGKHVRLGDVAALRILSGLTGHLLGGIGRSLVREGRPTGTRLLLSLWRGALASRRYPIDRERRLYQVPR
jgi:glycosyltransferase involved in cell wall biosynthesis